MNDKVKVKVLNVDVTNGKMDLSLKQAAVPDGPVGMSAPVLPRSYRRGGRGKRELPEGADPIFEEKLSKFLKTTENPLPTIKPNTKPNRGARSNRGRPSPCRGRFDPPRMTLSPPCGPAPAV